LNYGVWDVKSVKAVGLFEWAITFFADILTALKSITKFTESTLLLITLTPHTSLNPEKIRVRVRTGIDALTKPAASAKLRGTITHKEIIE